jgi:hypothetical protein
MTSPPPGVAVLGVDYRLYSQLAVGSVFLLSRIWLIILENLYAGIRTCVGVREVDDGRDNVGEMTRRSTRSTTPVRDRSKTPVSGRSKTPSTKTTSTKTTSTKTPVRSTSKTTRVATPAAAPVHNEFLNREAAKYFYENNKKKLYYGVVKEVRVVKQRKGNVEGFKVVYEDGDEEIVGEEEVRRMVEMAEKKRR